MLRAAAKIKSASLESSFTITQFPSEGRIHGLLQLRLHTFNKFGKLVMFLQLRAHGSEVKIWLESMCAYAFAMRRFSVNICGRHQGLHACGMQGVTGNPAFGTRTCSGIGSLLCLCWYLKPTIEGLFEKKEIDTKGFLCTLSGTTVPLCSYPGLEGHPSMISILRHVGCFRARLNKTSHHLTLAFGLSFVSPFDFPSLPFQDCRCYCSGMSSVLILRKQHE